VPPAPLCCVILSEERSDESKDRYRVQVFPDIEIPRLILDYAEGPLGSRNWINYRQLTTGH